MACIMENIDAVTRHPLQVYELGEIAGAGGRKYVKTYQNVSQLGMSAVIRKH